MVMVGDRNPDVERLINVTQKALYEAIKICGPGVPYKKIGEVCE